MTAPSISNMGPIQRRGQMPSTGSVIVRFVAGTLKAVGPRDFEGIAATDALCEQDRVALAMTGADLTRIQGGPLSWDHKVPIGTIRRAWTTQHQMLIAASFAPLGVDEETDALCRKVKGGIPMSLSVQFAIRKAEPIDPKRPQAGIRALVWVALEVALVLVGADPAARITARSHRQGEMNLKTATSHIEGALDEHRALQRHAQEIADSTDRLNEHRASLGTAMRGLHAAAQSGDRDAIVESHSRCMRCLTGLQRELRSVGDRHADATAASSAINRAISSAGSLLHVDGESDTGGADTSRGILTAEHRRREMELLKLPAPPADLERQLEFKRLQRIGRSY